MPIFLYVVRHGEAEAVQVNDEERQLTELGKQEANKTARWLSTQVSEFDTVVASPYIRAQQTKEIILSQNKATNVITSNQFIPSGIASTAIDELLAYAQSNNKTDQHILCVSHMPLVSYLIGELSGYTPIMATAAVAKLQINLEKWNGQLDTLISPEQILL